jgi:hypothetical protein
MNPEEKKQYHKRKWNEWLLVPGNREHKKEYMKEWRRNNKDKLWVYCKRTYENHREERLEKMKAYAKKYYYRNHNSRK